MCGRPLIKILFDLENVLDLADEPTAIIVEHLRIVPHLHTLIERWLRCRSSFDATKHIPQRALHIGTFRRKQRLKQLIVDGLLLNVE